MFTHNIYGRPIYYGDTIDYISPWKVERMREIEEERRRRAALEYAYRERERAIQEQERQENFLKHRQQQQEQEEDWNRRQKQKQISRQQQQQQQHQQHSSDDAFGSDLQYRIVLGPGGYLYRAPIKQEKVTASGIDESQKVSKLTPNVDFVDDEAETIFVTPSSSSSAIKIINDKNNRFITKNNGEEEPPGTPKADNTTKKSLKCWNHDGVVVVEDASDSESVDNDDLKSIWRNRLPSHGEWMEPVAPNLR